MNINGEINEEEDTIIDNERFQEINSEDNDENVDYEDYEKEIRANRKWYI
jgi:hypothetical protein